MYQVRVMVRLLARNRVMGLSRWLCLPFASFSGLDLHGITRDPCRAETIAVVGWDAAGHYFHAVLLDCEGREESLSDLIDAFDPDWELHKPGAEPVPEADGSGATRRYRLRPPRQASRGSCPSGPRCAASRCASRGGER
jgi:hypothetical protein